MCPKFYNEISCINEEIELEYVNFALGNIFTMFMLWWVQRFTNRKFSYFSLTTPLIHINSHRYCPHKELIPYTIHCMYNHQLFNDF
jgi:hypothetical protein